MIMMEEVCKSYKVAKRNAGFGEACKALFYREYEVVHALDHISFTIPDGEMVGYIGPNGAGKSSTIKILSGILTPDSGTCVVDGMIPWKNRTEYVKKIGVVFGQRSQLWWDIPVVDSFALLKEIYSIPTIAYRNKLDEPTIGLDAVSKLAVRDFIKRMNEEHKTTVILTTHDMQDIEAIAERVIVIGKGRVLLDGSIGELLQTSGSIGKQSEEEAGEGSAGIDRMVADLYRKLNVV